MTIYICGDSTAATYGPERAPSTGWGQMLGELLPQGITVENRAVAGRSTKSFLAEGRLTAIEQEIQPGDLLLIQFTHNDNNDLIWRHTDPHTSFASNLALFVDTARIHGATPVLLTPIPQRCWQAGVLLDTHGEYPAAMRNLALMRQAPLIDICEQGMAYLRRVGEAESVTLYMHVEPGQYPLYPNGLQDDTHTCRHGAEVYARMVADGLRTLKLI